ncbi:MAG: T9SS type A sorting domain-containing protein, partial [Lewinella sp.]|nr:T9SS type A sorting domain-containing protein [Lewinella sp.]
YLQHRVDWRSSTGGPNQTQSFSRFGQHWLRIVRTGPIFQAFTSNNGINWGLPVNTQVITMDDCLEVGLIVTNVPFATNVTATFSDVEVDGGNNPDRPDVPATQDVTASQLQVFPNPTKGLVTVNLGAFAEQPATLDVMDLNGRLVLRRTLGVIDHTTEQLDLSGQPAGVYLLRLRTEGGIVALQQIVLTPRL